MNNIAKIDLFNFDLEIGKQKQFLSLSYQVFGPPIGHAPIVVVNHSLTGNSNIAGNNGWWKGIVGENQPIDTNFYTIIAFNIPGNGFDGTTIENYRDYTIRDIARIFWEGLFYLKVDQIYAVVGTSLGGAIAWEMTALHPDKIENLIPIATDWKATDWIIANVVIQDQILNNSQDPIVDARLHATLLYRTPEYVNQRFKRSKLDHSSVLQIENWLLNHGKELKNRYTLPSYKLMNHLLKTNDITRDRKDFLTIAKTISSSIHIVTVDTDCLFVVDESRKTFRELRHVKNNVFYNQIQSIHGHDAFLIEFNQLSDILNPIFLNHKLPAYVSA